MLSIARRGLAEPRKIDGSRAVRQGIGRGYGPRTDIRTGSSLNGRTADLPDTQATQKPTPPRAPGTAPPPGAAPASLPASDASPPSASSVHLQPQRRTGRTSAPPTSLLHGAAGNRVGDYLAGRTDGLPGHLAGPPPAVLTIQAPAPPQAPGSARPPAIATTPPPLPDSFFGGTQ